MKTLNVSILDLNSTTVGCPEETANTGVSGGDYVGLCLSGGGSRALTCAMGQLRALHHLGLIGNVFAISSVSGGTWANTLYTYLPAHISDTDFLGTPVLDPSKLTVLGGTPTALDYLSPNNLGRVPTRLGAFEDISELIKLRDEWGYKNSDLWQGLVGEKVLKPFGLWNPDPANGNYDPHYFTWNSAYLNASSGILAKNPSLSSRDFYKVSRQRPFMVFNTSIFTDDTTTADLKPFEANFQLGVRTDFPDATHAKIGGGFMGAFAMGSSFVADIKGGDIETSVPTRPFSLADIAGCSSAAFAQDFEEKYPVLSGMVPRYDYFPIDNRTSVPAKSYRFADGGSLENLGLNVMLARNISRLLVGVNTDEAVTMENGEIVVSGDIPPLFGLQPYEKGKGYIPYSPGNEGSSSTRLYRHNQVFPTSSFAALQKALWAKKQAGHPLVVRTKLPVLQNDWYGVAGGGTVDILWMYNDFVSAFWNQLSWECKTAIDAAGLGAFPRYNTFTQLKLDAIEVNALAHLWCWNLAADWAPSGGGPTNADVTKAMFT